MILGCRSTQRGEAARKEITDSTGTTPVTVMDIDLSSLASVRAFATAFHERFAKLDVLVNHAATSLPAREVTPEGFERHWATKVLGPHLLTTPLISALRAELLLDEGAELLDLRRVAEAASGLVALVPELARDAVQLGAGRGQMVVSAPSRGLCAAKLVRDPSEPAPSTAPQRVSRPRTPCDWRPAPHRRPAPARCGSCPGTDAPAS